MNGASLRETRPMYWSIRRELWENRSIYIAPLAVIAFALLAFLFSTIGLPHRMRNLPALEPARQVGLPLLSFAIIITVQLIMLVVSTAVLLANGMSPEPLWTRLPLFQMTLALVYSLAAIALWHALIYGWLLLVSGWARRGVFLWAVMPLLAVAAFERGAFGTSHAGSFLKHRVIGWFTQSFDFKTPGGDPSQPLTVMTPGKFLSTPGLWIGLILAALFIARAVRLRRDREPI